MPETTPVKTAAQSPPDRAYRPLAALALAAVSLAGVFSIVVAVLGVVAFVSGTTLFLNLAWLLIPIAGVALALAARQQIRRSEGTLGGDRLVAWTLWLCLFFGLGFAAYYFGTFLAVRQQAAAFTDLWIKRIEEGKLTEAFLLTVDPAQRKFSDMDDVVKRFGAAGQGGRKGPLSYFHSNEIVRALQQGGNENQILNLGIKDWSYEKGGYQVVETYEVTNPFGLFAIQIVIHSIESKEFEGRQWNIVSKESKVIGARFSALGLVVESWQPAARAFAQRWIEKLHNRDNMGAFLDTLDPNQRAKISTGLNAGSSAEGIMNLASSVVQGLSSPVQPGFAMAHFLTSVGSSDFNHYQFLPGHQAFADGGIIQSDKLQSVRRIKPDVIRGAKVQFIDPNRDKLKMGEEPGHLVPIDHDSQQARYLFDVQFPIYPESGAIAFPNFICDASLVVETDKGEFTYNRKPDFRVVSLDLMWGHTPPADPGITKPSKRPKGQGPQIPAPVPQEVPPNN